MDRFEAPNAEDEKMTCKGCGHKTWHENYYQVGCPKDLHHAVCPYCEYCDECEQHIDDIKEDMEDDSIGQDS